MNMRERMRAVSVVASDKIELHACSSGRGDPLVFVHEFSGDARSWEAQVSYFSRYFRATVYCARGYPPSSVPTDLSAYSQERAADDLADVVRTVADGPAHIVGLSMGGFAALHFGLRHAHLARSLVVAGVGYGAEPEQQPQHAAQMCRDADHAESIGMREFARELSESGYAQCLRAKDESGWRRFADELAEHSVAGMAMTLRGVLATRPSLWHIEDRLRRLSVPMLLVTGDEDVPCLEPNLFLKRTLPDAALCVMPRTGHLLNLEEPALFNAIVLRFLMAVERGRWGEWRGRAIHPGPSEERTA
jgi:pimeloyl-ACP methyl ester carboxylesterase